MKFEKYHITDEIKTNLAALGFKRPTDIQYKAIPSILKGEDVLAIAQTGTGKTAAFAIPVIDMIHRSKSSKRAAGVQCLIMVPTRELARQIGQVFARLSKNTRVSTFALYGGVEQDQQIKQLQSGTDIVIATPGRMFDLISQGYLKLDHINIFVLDEADHMLDLGFIEDIKAIKKRLKTRHQTLFISATINSEIKKLAFSQVKSSAIRIQISPEDPVSKNVSHFVMFVEMDDKRHFLQRFIQDHPESKLIVFVRTRVRAERVSRAMARVQISTRTLHGEKDQQQRFETLEQFRTGENKILIATDVSARGIDIPDVEFVINYDLPEKTENYVHRVGRTGRGTNKGRALSFCSIEEKPILEKIQTFLNKPVEIIKISKNNYAFTLNPPDKLSELKALMEGQDAWKTKKRKKRNKKK